MDNVRRHFFSLVTKHIWVQNEQSRDIFETCPCQVIKDLLQNKAYQDIFPFKLDKDESKDVTFLNIYLFYVHFILELIG